MFLAFCSLVLLSAIQIQGSYDFYSHYCSGNYYSDPSKVFFCQYVKGPSDMQKVPFPTDSECTACKELLKKITWNSHSEDAIDSLLDYTTKHFCEDIKRTTSSDCKNKLKEYKPKMKEFLVKMMKDSTFCEVLLKCKEKKGVMFVSYFSQYKPDWMDFYSMPFFEYFFNLENYSKDFYPYYFFNYFYQYQETGFPSSAYLEHFFENPKNDSIMHPYRFLEYFFSNDSSKSTYFPFKFFEYFFKNSHYESDFYPYKFFEEFFSDEHYDFFSKDQKPSDKFCKRCENIPASRFLKWAKSIDIKMLTDAGFKVMCSGMKSTEQEKCREIILHVGRVIFHELESVLSVKSICYKIYRCPMNIESNTEAFSFYEKSRPKKTTKQCEVCSMITNIFANALDNDLFEEYVAEMFQVKYCNKLFPKKENECKNFLKTELPNILNKLRVSLHKNYLCNLTCNGNPNSLWSMEFSEFFSSFNSQKCPACKIIMALLKSLIRSSDFKSEVYRRSEESYCDIIFKSKTKCRTFLKNNYTSIIKNMSRIIEGNLLCKPYCKKNDLLMFPSYYYYEVEETSCDMCEDLVDALEELNPSLITIDNDLNRLCPLFTGKKEKYCKTLLEQYKTQIKTLIINNRPKDEICRTINQCFTNPKFYGIFSYQL